MSERKNYLTFMTKKHSDYNRKSFNPTLYYKEAAYTVKQLGYVVL